MALQPLELATVDEIRLLAATAMAGVEDYFDDDGDDGDDDDFEQRWERLQAAIAGLRFCATVAAHLGAEELVELIVDMIEVFPHFESVEDDDVHGLARDLETLLQRGALVTDGVARLARHRDVRLRYHVAKGLRADDDLEVALLTQLAADPVADVRNEARKALAQRGAPPWWHGKLSRDPVEGLSPEEQTTHREALQQIAQILDLPSHRIVGRHGELARIAAGLPDAVAVDLAESMMRSFAAFGSRHPALPAMMLARRGGVPALLRILGRWAGDTGAKLHGTKVFVEALEAEPLPRRREVVSELVRFALAATTEQSAPLSAADLAGEIAGKAWPAGDDTEPLLDAILAAPPPPKRYVDAVASGLAEALAHPPAEPARMFQRAIEARLDGYPGRLAAVSHALERLIEAAPREAVRAAAAEALGREDDATAGWGLSQILGPSHDPTLDPPVPEQIARMLAVPRYRALIFQNALLLSRAAPTLRVELRAGSLRLAEAARLMETLDHLWGGAAQSPLLASGDPGRTEARREAARVAWRATVAPHLGPPELQGPPTEEEWRVLRALRLHEPDAHVIELVDVFPEGAAWHPDDLAAIAKAMAKPRGGASFLALALSTRPTAESLRYLDELAVRHPDDDVVRDARRLVAKALGVAPASGEAPRAREWMDEPED